MEKKQTEIVCPECGDAELVDIMPPHSFGKYKSMGKDGKWVDLEHEGTAKCNKCFTEFLYRLDVAVVCATAKHPFRTRPEAKETP